MNKRCRLTSDFLSVGCLICDLKAEADFLFSCKPGVSVVWRQKNFWTFYIKLYKREIELIDKSHRYCVKRHMTSLQNGGSKPNPINSRLKPVLIQLKWRQASRFSSKQLNLTLALVGNSHFLNAELLWGAQIKLSSVRSSHKTVLSVRWLETVEDVIHAQC